MTFTQKPTVIIWAKTSADDYISVDFVEKELGKGLSSNDFTTEEKETLARLTKEQNSSFDAADKIKLDNMQVDYESGTLSILTSKGILTFAGVKTS